MNRHILSGVICFILLFLLTGMCIAEESPADLFYFQGGASAITEEPIGTYVGIVQDIVPYLHIANGSQGTSTLTHIEVLDTISYPLNAALVFSGEDNEGSFMVEVSNLSFCLENKTLTFLIKPLEFYEGDVLKPFAHDNNELMIDVAEKSRSTGMYLEMFNYPPKNAHYPIFD